jgi:hypothetical protein
VGEGGPLFAAHHEAEAAHAAEEAHHAAQAELHAEGGGGGGYVNLARPANLGSMTLEEVDPPNC